MSGKRWVILAGMVGGALWAVAVIWFGMALGHSAKYLVLRSNLPGAVATGLLPGGLVMMAMVARLAQRRFFDDGIIDGAPFPPGSPAEIDQRALTNTAEQLVLAAAIWPAAAVVLGLGVPLTLGLSFGLARLLFWIGYHRAPPLRGFGFAASFYPTVAAALVVLWKLVAG